MGVQCKLLGHVYDSMEFEERQEGRPNGTVLICREYHVCKRCGNREEMYRNEQLLTPESDPTTAQSLDGTDAHGAGTEGSQADEQGKQDTAQTPAENPTTTDGDAPDATDVADADPAGNRDDEQRGVSTAGPVSAGASVTSGSHDEVATDTADGNQVTDDAVILSDSTGASTPTRTHATEPRADGTGSPSIDTDAVGPLTVPSDAREERDVRITCSDCGEEWQRAETSLRAGDLCPSCRAAYIRKL